MGLHVDDVFDARHFRTDVRAGPILVLFFSLTLYWFPPARWDGFATRSAVLPVLTLSVIYMAYIARLTRSGMLEVLRSDYIRTARAKGLSEPPSF